MSPRARAAVALTLSVLAGAAARAPADPTAKEVAARVSAVAAAYYCNCGGWPASWDALREFDQRVTANAPAERFPWETYRETVVSRTPEQSLQVDLAGPAIPKGTRIHFKPPQCPADGAKLKAHCPTTPQASDSKPSIDSEKETIELANRIGSAAGPYYCSCGGWPTSWQLLREWDEAWNADWAAHGSAPPTRFPWERYEKSSLVTNEKDELLIQLVPAPLPGKHIGFKPPDCSTFDGKSARRYCPAAR